MEDKPLFIDLTLESTAQSLGISVERQKQLHQLCQNIVDLGCAGNLSCADTIELINRYADVMTCKELIFIAFKMGRIFQIAQKEE